ncbi:MAG: protein kinase family protein [Gammaproteobacteria bacterium]
MNNMIINSNDIDIIDDYEVQTPLIPVHIVPGGKPEHIPHINRHHVQVISELADGGQAVVYKASLFRPTPMTVALKTFNNIRDYRAELNIHLSLNHPHIIKLLGSTELGAKGSLILALATRGTLQDYLDDFKGPLRTQKKSVQYANDLTQGVYYLHSQRVLHGDIKPLNTLIMENGSLVINDFGFSKRIRYGCDEVVIKEKIGTTHYRPAEGYPDIGNSRYTLGYDIYALGWILYLLTTDNDVDPYNDEHKYASERLHKSHKLPTIPRTASITLATLILSCMAKNPKERPTALQVLEVVGQENIVFRPKARPSPTRQLGGCPLM